MTSEENGTTPSQQFVASSGGNSRFSPRFDPLLLSSSPDSTSVFTSAEEMSEEKTDIPNELLGKKTITVYEMAQLLAN